MWPVGQPGLRARVLISMALLVGGKIVNIQVPFIFKHIVDALTPVGEVLTAVTNGAAAAASSSAVAAAAVPPEHVALATVGAVIVPSTLLLGYGLARATAGAMQELRNAVFASVAQRAIRLVSRDVFR